MGEEDIRRQKLNVFNMRTMGSTVVPVTTGSRTLRDATNKAMRDWMGSSVKTHYTIGSVVGSHPFPMIVRDFQAVIGREARQQCLEKLGRLPDCAVACVGGGSNAAGFFYRSWTTNRSELVGAEAGGAGRKGGARLKPHGRRPGVLHGSMSYVLQDGDGQTLDVHSISAGLDYPGVGPQHAYLAASGRASYTPVTDAEAMDAMALLSRTEGIIPAIESAHAIAGALQVAKDLRRRRHHADQPVGPRRQGHGDRDRVVPPRRRRGWAKHEPVG